MVYMKPKMEIFESIEEDVICMSVNGNHDPNNPGDITDAGGDWTLED